MSISNSNSKSSSKSFKYKRPDGEIVEAVQASIMDVQNNSNTIPEWLMPAFRGIVLFYDENDLLQCRTGRKTIRVYLTDWIVKNEDGTLYIEEDRNFKKYEAIKDSQ
jgi:hypothetical protein